MTPKDAMAPGAGISAREWVLQRYGDEASKWTKIILHAANFREQLPTPETREVYAAEFPSKFYSLFAFEPSVPAETFQRRGFVAYLAAHPDRRPFVDFIPDLARYCTVVPNGAVLVINDRHEYQREIQQARARWWVANRLPLTADEREFIHVHLPTLVESSAKCPNEAQGAHR